MHSSPYGPAGGALRGTFPNPTLLTDEASLVITSRVFGDHSVSPSSPSSSSVGGLVNFTEAVSTAAPNGTTPVVSLTPNNAAADVTIALVPKGAGALVAAVSNNLTTGGNVRGVAAVDWQLSRTANSQVASGGSSTITGGLNNTASGTYSVVSGRGNSTAAQDSAIVGGHGNTIASGATDTVIGGNSHTVGAAASISACFGSSHDLSTASGQFAAGFLHTLTGQYSACFGSSGIASAAYAFVNGNNCTADAINGTAWGISATTRTLKGSFAFSSGVRVALGDAQRLDACLRVQTTGATQTAMTSTGGAAASTNQFKLPNNSVMKLKAHVTAINRTSGDVSAWEIYAVCKNIAGTLTLVGTQTRTLVAQDAGASAWAINILADTTNTCIQLAATGVAATTIDWSAACSTIVTA